MKHKKLLEEMSWTEFSEVRKHVDTVLIPMGSVEVEGPHLPLNVDSIVAMEVARRVSDVIDETIVAPVMNVTYSDWHTGFPGTLTYSLKTLLTMVEEICTSLIKNGFKRLFFVNSHVGNDPTIWAAANKLSVDGLARVGMVSIWSLSTEVGKEIEALEEKTFLHAGEIMTSVVMAIRPDLVDMKAATTEYLKPLTDGYQAVLSRKSRVNGKLISFYHTSNELTQSGVMGNPSAASPEKGELILGKLVEQTSETVKEFGKLPIPKGV